MRMGKKTIPNIALVSSNDLSVSPIQTRDIELWTSEFSRRRRNGKSDSHGPPSCTCQPRIITVTRVNRYWTILKFRDYQIFLSTHLRLDRSTYYCSLSEVQNDSKSLRCLSEMPATTNPEGFLAGFLPKKRHKSWQKLKFPLFTETSTFGLRSVWGVT